MGARGARWARGAPEAGTRRRGAPELGRRLPDPSRGAALVSRRGGPPFRLPPAQLGPRGASPSPARRSPERLSTSHSRGPQKIAASARSSSRAGPAIRAPRRPFRRRPAPRSRQWPPGGARVSAPSSRPERQGGAASPRDFPGGPGPARGRGRGRALTSRGPWATARGWERSERDGLGEDWRGGQTTDGPAPGALTARALSLPWGKRPDLPGPPRGARAAPSCGFCAHVPTGPCPPPVKPPAFGGTTKCVDAAQLGFQ